MTSYNAITNLLYRYAEHIDSGNLEAAADMFRHARIKRGPGILLSHSDILAFWRQIVVIYADGTPRTRHMVTNPIVEIDEVAGAAACRSCYTVLQHLDDFPLQVIAVGRYHDEFERVDGEWRFSFRDYSFMDFRGDLSRHIPSTLPGFATRI